ncbi:chromosome partitioning protein ParA (plasmid) [Corynebacterium phocae]|uniref:Chromosome partitioning protein ParA n=1 Tax=Corynebacterium phocae TaxID=161895 RepID=A0A1L7D6Q1_9CORY|nr:ParA family protein [Corynebacterium phocae]APT93829.1 chromosome partitioning protein ParA [Corynebacterium phocae]KAA8719786.1 ParA family protein [Corynebacterium phocae]
MRIAFVHTKGGVGKTTGAVLLAAAAHARGLAVEVFDADPQGSATRWAEVASATGDPLPFPIRPVTARVLRSAPVVDGWQIVDTPPGTAAEIQAAIDTADLVIIPTHPTPIDIDRVWPTLETVEHRMTGVLLVGVQERRRLYRDTREVFESQGVATFYNFIPEREALKAAFGTNPTELFTFPDICQEILDIEEMD